MAKKGTTSMWKTVLQGALAVLLIFSGLAAFGIGGGADLLTAAIAGTGWFGGTLLNIIIYAVAVIEIVAGALLILDFFHIKALDKLDDLFLLIIMICWLVVFVVFGDIIPLIKGSLSFIPFLVKLAGDAVILSAMGIIKAKI